MIGENVSHYRILEKIGGGGMGVVYKAEDTKLKRIVALKFLPQELTWEDEAKDRFIQEARLASALDHPNICNIHEIDETDDGQIFIVMACYEGESLKEKISRGPIPLKEALEIVVQIASGLEKAHEKGIIHRDIKPANIFLTKDRQIKIIDFGLAKLTGETLLTKAGSTKGTVVYMSPEQTQGTNIDHKTDIWSLGVVLYEMLYGVRPFKGDYDLGVIYSIINDEPEFLDNVKPDIPVKLKEIISRCLEKNPDNRYRTLKNLLKDLETVTEMHEMINASSYVKIFLRKSKTYIFAAIVILILIIGLNIEGIRTWIWGGGDSSSQNIKLAVLPFANLTGDSEQEYLADGFTQEMISQLGRLHPKNLSVIARSSVMHYKNSNATIQQIGRELGVNYILEGSTRRDMENIRISADLIKVEDQTRLWGKSYERKFSSILKLQSEVAQQVTEALAINLLPSQKDRLSSAITVNPQAYDYYLKGQFHWGKLTPEDLDMAMQYFELARKEDPDFALAYAGIALAWAGKNQFGLVKPSEAGSKGMEAAMKALELDESLTEVHYALATIQTWYGWDWKAAEKSFRSAIELNPNYPDVRAFYSHYLFIMRRPEEAMIQIEKSLELDPFNPLFQSLYGVDFIFLQRYDDAIEQFHKALKTVPNHGLALSNLTLAYFMKKEYSKSFNAMKAYYTAFGFSDGVKALDDGYEEGGFHGAMSSAAKIWEALSRQTYISPFGIIELYAYTGNKTKTIEYLEKGIEIRDPNAPYIGIWPTIINLLKDEPRYRNLLRKMNLQAGG